MKMRKSYAKERNKFSKFKRNVNADELKLTIERSYQILSAISDLPKEACTAEKK